MVFGIMGKRITLCILMTLLCSSLFADIPWDIHKLSVQTTNTSEASSVTSLPAESIIELIDLRYGTAVDKMVFYNNLFIAAISIIVGVALFTGLHGANKKIMESADAVKRVAEELGEQKETYNGLLIEMEYYKEDYKKILIADLIDEVRDLVDFNKSDLKKDTLAMKRIEALKRISELPLDLQVAESAILFRQGDYMKALEVIEIVKKQDLNNPDLYFKSGFCKQKLNKDDQALLDYGHALELDEKNVPSLINRSIIFIKQGKYSEAINDYLKAIDVEPANKTVWQGLTNATLKAGNLGRAEKIFEIAEQNGIPIENYLLFNRICLWSLQGRFEDCEEPLLAYIIKFPERILEVLDDPHLDVLFKHNPPLYQKITGMVLK